MNKSSIAPAFFSCLAPLALAAPALLTAQTPELDRQAELRTTAAQPQATAPAPVAYAYVQTLPGVNVYSVNAAGQLTLIPGSPFAETGQMEGNNGGYLVTVGTDDLHSYKIEAGGAVGPQAGVIDTQSYAGSEYGPTSDGSNPNGAIFDHTGHDFYVQLCCTPGSGGVYASGAAWQSYGLGTTGAFSFLGDIQYSGAADHDATQSSVPTVSSNDGFAYGVFPEFSGFSYTSMSAFTRSSGGVLEVNNSFTETDPKADPNMPDGPWEYFPALVQADPAGHLAVLLNDQTFSGCCGAYGPQQLASYTINSYGGISSTNTYANMPTPAFTTVNSMDMSPSGALLAVAGAPGLQVFHFNGASPVTAFGAPLLTNINIDQLAWDNSNHLFALSYESNQLYVYTVTPTSITPVAGSPYKVSSAYGIKGLIVVN